MDITRWLILLICVAGLTLGAYFTFLKPSAAPPDSQGGNEFIINEPPVPIADVTVEGTITYPDGSPAAGALVELVTVDHLNRPTQKTGADGKYRFDGYERGHFWVGVDVDGYQFINHPVIASLQAKHTIDLQLQRLATWQGHVVDSGDRPIRGALVRLNAGHTSGTGEEGEFAVSGVEAERYTLLVLHPDYTPREFETATLAELPKRITLVAE